MNAKENESREYIYELCLVESIDKSFEKEIIGLFTEDNLEEIKEIVGQNGFDINEGGCFNYAFIDKIQINHVYAFPIERLIYKYEGNDTYRYLGTVAKRSKIWLDDERPAPDGYIWCKSVLSAQQMIKNIEQVGIVTEIDVDHDLGNTSPGGDAINLLDWLVERKTFYPIKIHTMNPVGRENMKRLIERYWPKKG